LIRIALSLCGVMEAVHSQGHVVGNISEKNLFVSNTVRVTLVDCESIQVQDNERRRRYTPPLGNAALTPPEPHVISADVQRETVNDRFTLAVAIFMLLMEGAHPFRGTWHGDGATPTLEENIRHGRYAYARWGYLGPDEGSLSLEVLPPAFGRLFERCFI